MKEKIEENRKIVALPRVYRDRLPLILMLLWRGSPYMLFEHGLEFIYLLYPRVLSDLSASLVSYHLIHSLYLSTVRFYLVPESRNTSVPYFIKAVFYPHQFLRFR